MTTVSNSFVSNTQLSLLEVSLITSEYNEKKLIGKMVLTNTSALPVVVTFWRLSASNTGTTGSGGNYSLIKTIPANRTIEIYELEGQWVDNSMKLSGLADTASVINVDISGNTETET